jgi:hypothetical protein
MAHHPQKLIRRCLNALFYRLAGGALSAKVFGVAGRHLQRRILSPAAVLEVLFYPSAGKQPAHKAADTGQERDPHLPTHLAIATNSVQSPVQISPMTKNIHSRSKKVGRSILQPEP